MLSVVIPAYNSGGFLADAIRSVLGQTVRDWELIVVDDGSVDDTPAVASALARGDDRIRLVRQRNRGVAQARNRGLSEISPSSRLVAFLDSDDVWHPDALEVLSGALADHPAASAAYGLPLLSDGSGTPPCADVERAFGYRRATVRGGRVVAWAPELPATFEVLAVWDVIATPGQVLIRRDALTAAGPFDPSIPASEDWDMWIRLSLVGDLQPVLRFVMEKRSRPGSLSSGRGLVGAEDSLRRKLATLPGLSPDQRRTLAVAHRHGPRLRLGWAREAVRRGEPWQAARHVRQAGTALGQYLRATAGRTPVRAATR